MKNLCAGVSCFGSSVCSDGTCIDTCDCNGKNCGTKWDKFKIPNVE